MLLLHKDLLKRFILLILVLFISINGFGQSPFFKHVKIFKNKKDYTVNVIYQDDIGYMWFGTSEGLAKYDGIDFTYYTTKDSLYNNHITALYQDKNGILWIGDKRGGISKYYQNKIERFNPEEGLSSAPITSLFVDRNNTLWFSTEGEGVYYYYGKRKRLYNLWTEEGVADHAYCFEEDNSGNIWIGTDNGISIYNFKDKKTTSVSMKKGLPDNIVKHLYKSSDNKMIIGMEEAGIIKYDLKTGKFENEIKQPAGSLNDFVLNNNEYWISTAEKGIYRIISKNGNYEYQYFNDKTGLINKKTSTVFIDREFNLWAGTEKGIAKCNLSTFEFLNEKDGLEAKMIYDLVITEDKKWICTEIGLLTIEKDNLGNLIIKEPFKNKLPNTTFISLFKDSGNYLWAGTYNEGVFRINPENYEIKQFTVKNGLADNNVISITGNDNILWFSTLGGGVSYTSVNNVTDFKTINATTGLKSNYVYQTIIDKNDQVWFAQDGGGLTMLKNNKFIHFGEKEGLFSNSIYSITEDVTGELWLVSDNGIYNYNGTSFKNYNEENGLKSLTYTGIFYHKSNKIILVSNEGIEILNPTDDNIAHYGEESGVAYLEPNLNSIFTDENNNFWIGTNNGIIKFDPDKTGTKDIHPKIVITKKQAYFKDITDSTISLPHNENHMIFNYTGLWFTSPENLTYKYILEGYDLDWNFAGNSKTQTYSNLPPGDYTFKVMVSHITGIWTESEDAKFSFSINPPFWKTWWFITALVIFILFVIYSIFKIRLRNLTKQKEELEEEVKRRTAKIMNQKEEIETQRDEIEYQNREITHSINYASRIQAALIQSEICDNSISNHFIMWKPRDIVSGDFYWIREVNEKIFYVASDCTGHGVPGAFMSMMGIAFLDELILRRNILKPSKILEELRKQIKHSLSQGGEHIEQKDGMDMALTVIDKKELKMEYSGAYNPLYLFRNNELIEYKATRNPVGVYAKEIPFKNNEIKLQKDDMIYIFSDGFVDQFGGEKGQKYKSRNFKNFLKEIHNEKIDNQKEMLETEFSNWTNDIYDQIDDILIIGIRIK